MKYHCTLVRIAIVKQNFLKITHVEMHVEKLQLLAIVGINLK